MIALEKIMRKEIETERLILRDVVDSDRQSIYQLYSDKASSLLDDWEPMEHEDEAALKIREIRREFTEREGITFIIEKKDTKEFIGCCGMFEFDAGNSNCCVFYQVDKRKRNHGFATEAMRAITRYGIKELELHRMYAYITPGNDASIRVLEKCGYKNEGLLRDMEFFKGRYWDGIVMAIIEQDYLRS